MTALGGMMGLSGGMGGTGFSANSGTNAGQLNETFDQNKAAQAQQQSLLAALQGQGGLQKQGAVYNQFQNIAAGQGPNPAQAMLNQATGANVANQASLMAGQRGAGSNVGLMARQAAQTGANMQQQAAGQGASMQAQQALGALGQAGNMATGMANNQVNQTNQNANSIQNEQSILQGANTANNNIQGQMAQQTMAGQQKMIGGMFNSMGGAFAEGGPVSPTPVGPQSMFGKSLSMFAGGGEAQGSMPTFHTIDNSNNPKEKKPSQPKSGGVSAGDSADFSNVAAGGGKVPAMVSPGERFLRPNEAKAVADGKVSPTQVGEKIPGQAQVKGDSYKNDTVRKNLDVGGIVIPRSIENSKNPGAEAKRFVDAYMAKKKVKKS